MTKLSVVPRASIALSEALADFAHAIELARTDTEADALWTELLAIERRVDELSRLAMARLHALESQG